MPSLSNGRAWVIGCFALLLVSVLLILFVIRFGPDSVGVWIAIFGAFAGAATALVKKYPGSSGLRLGLLSWKRWASRHKAGAVTVVVIVLAVISGSLYLTLRSQPSSLTAETIQLRYGQNGLAAFPDAVELSGPDLVLADRATGKKSDKWFSDVKQKGAVSLKQTIVQLTLHNDDAPIYVKNITIDQTKRTDPLHGTLVCAPSEGSTDVISMTFNGDDLNPVAQGEFPDPRYQGGQLAPGPYFSNMALSVNKDEEVVVGISVNVTQYYEEFYVLVTYEESGELRTFRIGDDGDEPFRVTGGADKGVDPASLPASFPLYENGYVYLLSGPNSGTLVKVDPRTYSRKNYPDSNC